MPRLLWECTKCGLRVEGKVNTLGNITADDRGPAVNAVPLPCVCMTCERVNR